MAILQSWTRLDLAYGTYGILLGNCESLSINIDSQDCKGFFVQKDYKMFPPSVNLDNIDWSTTRLQIDFPVLVLLTKKCIIWWALL
ncbi:sulfite oxidase isoform X2 [Helianthus annuus]|uniref:sulfite oxidase isoform X2 n=1 Tax=Helianthus annuus TaxID=4232 RepID=UPI000B8FF367|nr:sulfite oxidase isoform X2 [Helianthus annuus]